MSEKLQKILAQAGLGSRREMERWIEAGRIRINHTLAKLGDRADHETFIEVDGTPLRTPENTKAQPAILMYNKPIGELCTRHDPKGRPTVFDQLPAPPSGRWIVVGRLDYNTSGLLLFTNNGELANQLMHPSFHLTRTYAVRVYGTVLDSVLNRLTQGVELEDGEACFDSVESMGGDGRNHWYKVLVSMGKNRIVRRLWEAQSVKVNRLIRIAFGSLTLPRELEAGKYRLLTQNELKVFLANLTFNAFARSAGNKKDIAS